MVDTINTGTSEEQTESQQYSQEMIEKGEQLIENNNPNQEERPDWLPEKFKNAEQLANAYKNLEQKLGSNSNNEEETEAPAQEEMPNNEEVVAAVNESGLDFNALQEEYNELGGLSEETFSELEKAGFPQDLVSSWIKGQEAVADSFQNSVYETVGGKETYSEMIEWAADNLSQGEQDAFDRAIDTGDLDTVRLAIAGLQSKYQAVEGADPSLIGGQSSNTTGGTYGSWAEVTAAMRDSRYNSDPAYRQQVSTKLARSQLS